MMRRRCAMDVQQTMTSEKLLQRHNQDLHRINSAVPQVAFSLGRIHTQAEARETALQCQVLAAWEQHQCKSDATAGLLIILPPR
jgi:hypothetical protein